MLLALYKYKIIIDNLSERCRSEVRNFPKDDTNENALRKLVITRLSGTAELSKKIFEKGTLEDAKKIIKI